MKAKELRELGKAELIKKKEELKEDVFRLRIKLSTGELEDTAKIRRTRKDIARIETILTQMSGDK